MHEPDGTAFVRSSMACFTVAVRCCGIASTCIKLHPDHDERHKQNPPANAHDRAAAKTTCLALGAVERARGRARRAGDAGLPERGDADEFFQHLDLLKRAIPA